MTIAVFDVDGTLVLTGTERQFFRWLLYRGKLGPWQLLSFLGFAIRWCTVYGRHTFKKNKAYLNGLDEQSVAEEADRFVAERISRQFYEPCVGRLRSHQADGEPVFLLTGTLRPIADAIAQHLDITHVIASCCTIEDGRYTAAPPEHHPFGADKFRLLQSAPSVPPDSIRTATAYADSIRDLELLERVAHPVCVNPDRRLRDVALLRDWEVLDDGSATTAVRTQS